MEFEAFPKLPRLNRGMVISEKIDGTNGCVVVEELEGYEPDDAIAVVGGLALYAQSRKRLITPEQDNFGFAGWVKEHADELAMLGPGRHFGEWWGLGIQRRYDQDRKRFSLFNSSRWTDNPDRPECCDVVPVLAAENFSQAAVERCCDELRANGSAAAPGFMEPEGVVVYLSSARSMFKVTLKDDDLPKSLAVAA